MTKRRQNLKKRIFFAFFSLKTSLPARGTICCAVLHSQARIANFCFVKMRKINFFCIFLAKNLVNSKKSSNFAVRFAGNSRRML